MKCWKKGSKKLDRIYKIYRINLSIGQLDIALSVVVAEIVFITLRHCGSSEECSARYAGLGPVVRVVAVTGQSCSVSVDLI